MFDLRTSFFRFLSAAALLAVLIAPAWAQDDGDRLIAEDGDLRIYRSDDGQIKIKRDGDDDWSVVIDVDGDRTFVFSGSGLDDPLHRARVRWHGDDDDHPFVFFGDGEPLVDVARFGTDLSEHLTESLAPLAFVGDAASMEARREVFRMDAEAQRLARRARRAEGSERAELEAELDELLNEIFDKKLELRQDRLDAYEEEAAELRAETGERRQRRAEIIERRKRDLLGENDPLDW